MSQAVATPLRVLVGRLSSALNRANLIAQAQHIQHLPEHWQREQAARIVKRKINEFKHRIEH